MTSPILVTGGAGFIGSHFARLVVSRGWNVIVFDRLTYAGKIDKIADLMGRPGFTFVEGDIRSEAAVDHILYTLRPSAIVNFAAETHVTRSIENPEPFVQSNAVGTATLLQCGLKYRDLMRPEQFRFLQVSTDEVYGSLEIGAPGFTEDSPCRPNNPYAATKAAGDHLVRSYHKTYGLDAVITRCSNNYGPHQHAEKLVACVIQRALAGQEIPIHGDGGQVRDWLYVEDHCEAIWRALQDGQPGEIYNISSGDELTVKQTALKICGVVGAPESLLVSAPDRPGNDRRYGLDSSKITRELGWTPYWSLEQGLENTVQWFAQQAREAA